MTEERESEVLWRHWCAVRWWLLLVAVLIVLRGLVGVLSEMSPYVGRIP